MPALPRLLLVTDRPACARHGRGVIATVARALADLSVDGAVAVVARQPGATEAEAADLCAGLRPICRAAGACLFAHGHPALVGPLGLDGCHLPERMNARLARLRMPRGAILGASRHPPASSADLGVDYITWSPIFSPSSKADSRPPLGVDTLADHDVPVFALGGVTADNAAACVDAGAVGVAVAGFVCGAADPRQALLALLDALDVPARRRR